MRACRDCIDICNLCASLLMRRDELSASICDLCAVLCLRCSIRCQQLSGNVYAQQCAHSCRECARLCRELAGTVPLAG